MYITEIQIRDLVNFKGDHTVSFPVTEDGIPNDLYVLVGQNNSGKSSLLQLAQACTDTGYLKRHWKNINLSETKPSLEQPSEEEPNGIVICKMKVLQKKEEKVSGEKEIFTAFYKTPNCGVYAWAESNKGEKKVPRFEFMKLTRGETVALYSVEPKDEGSVNTNYMTYMTKKIKAALKNRWHTQEDHLPWEGMGKPLKIQTDSQSIREAWGELDSDVKKDVIDFIKRIGYEHYEVRETKPGGMMITDTNTGLDFDINRLPDGHLYLWRMAIQMSRCCLPNEKTKCLIIDEPTRSMHPSLVHHLSAEMREYCQKHKLQFIITSHSPAIVRALRLSNVFLATRMQDGTTNVRALIDTKSSKQGEQHAKFVLEKNMEDILFARIVMIVEGASDRRLFSMLLSKLSRLQEADLCKALGIVPDQHSCTATEPSNQHLIESRRLLRDIIVVAAGGKNNVANFSSHLDFLGIPYFMVVDGDLVWPNETAEVSVENLFEEHLMQNLFKGSDMLRDEILLNELKTLFQDSTGCVSGPVMSQSLGNIKKSHDEHKEGICKCKDGLCLEAVDNSLEAGRRSLARKRLECVVECTFAIKLSQEEKQKLTDEEKKELVEEKRKERFEEEWKKLPNEEKVELITKERETLTGDKGEELTKKRWIQKKITEERGKDLAGEETRKIASKEWETLVEKDRKSWTDQDKKTGSTIFFKRYTKLLQNWFRLFVWRHEKPLNLESVVKPFISKIAQLSDAPGAMGDKDLEQLHSSYSQMKSFVHDLKKKKISKDSFKNVIEQKMNDTLRTTIDRDLRELLYFGLTGITHREMMTLVNKMVKGVMTPETFAKEFTKSRTLKKQIAQGFTASEIVTLVDEMIQGIIDNITPDLRDFLVFLEIRVLPYYAQHEKVRKLKLIDSNIEKVAEDLKVKCTLQDEGGDHAEIET